MELMLKKYKELGKSGLVRAREASVFSQKQLGNFQLENEIQVESQLEFQLELERRKSIGS